MASTKPNSLENYLLIKLWSLCLIILVLTAIVGWKMAVKWQWLFIIELAVIFLATVFIASIKQQVMRSFTRASLHIDAIAQHNFEQLNKPAFGQGKVADFHKRLKLLGKKLQQRELQLNQHERVVYQLFEHLNFPILIFNEQAQLVLGNNAVHSMFHRPWEELRDVTADSLGLTYHQHKWCFIDSALQSNWLIVQNKPSTAQQSRQLLMFIDISTANKLSKLNSWQAIIDVLGDEICDSLTAISSMAETLADKAKQQSHKKALKKISESCDYLQAIVDRYDSIFPKTQIDCQWVSVNELLKSISPVAADIKINTLISVEKIWADFHLLEQVLLNLLYNSIEAQATEIQINVNLEDQFFIIELVDNGVGYSEISNLFMPLYSTKQNGQGIGLTFCRTVIELHHGVIELHNNDNQGVSVMLVLPIPMK